MKLINTILLCLYLFIVPASALAQDEAVALTNYMNSLISEGYKIVSDPSASSEQKFKRSSEMIKANLHLDWMAKYSLGRNKRALSPEKLKEFVDVYTKFVVNAYADLSRHYNGEKAVVKKVKIIDDKMFIVNMEIVKTDSASPIKVDYLIHQLDNGAYKVADIITEGVSILNSQQSEFNSVISSQGIDALIADLKEKVSRKEEKEKTSKKN
jgi:phospholipid transport system substrate-binding protein